MALADINMQVSYFQIRTKMSLVPGALGPVASGAK